MQFLLLKDRVMLELGSHCPCPAVMDGHLLLLVRFDCMYEYCGFFGLILVRVWFFIKSLAHQLTAPCLSKQLKRTC